jgi:hypothetical protein
LNVAQKEIYQERYSKRDGDPGIYFEVDERTRLELGSLIKNYKTATFDKVSVNLHPNAQFVSLPSDCLYSLQEQCIVGYIDCNNDSVTGPAMVVPMKHDEYMANIDNPFTNPEKKTIWRMDYGVTSAKKHELIHAQDQTIDSYQLRYLRSPLDIDINNKVNCELHASLHEEIVDRAIRVALTMISQLNQTKKVTV